MLKLKHPLISRFKSHDNLNQSEYFISAQHSDTTLKSDIGSSFGHCHVTHFHFFVKIFFLKKVQFFRASDGVNVNKRGSLSSSSLTILFTIVKYEQNRPWRQCDQMGGLFFIIWLHSTTQISPKLIKSCQRRFKILPNTK